MRIAIVHDDLVQQGGAERLVEEMAKVWPEADVYTITAASWAKRVFPELRTSFVGKIPFSASFLYKALFPWHPLAVESFNLNSYDVVLSSSARFALGVITQPKTKHICYINSPGRMWWEPWRYFSKSWHPNLLAPFLSQLRLWSFIAAQRVDYFIANSENVRSQIGKYFHREAEVIYPFVDLDGFGSLLVPTVEREPYFLVVSRLVRWKRLEVAIEACNKLKRPLVIIGDGPDRNRLQGLAGPTTTFLGRRDRQTVINYLHGCQALLHPQEEDFGIVPLEAMGAGKPIIAYRGGGALETVIEGKTGAFFWPQTGQALEQTLAAFQPGKFSETECRRRAADFSKEKFREKLQSFVSNVYALPK
ncbi:MAG: glycosyltransferase [bacterium]|nr:glycosyltransferase [bacterium]